MLQSVLNFLTTPITVGEAVFFSPLQIALRFLLPITALLIVYRLLLFLQRKLILTPLKIKQETKTKIARYTRIVLRIILLLAIIIVVSMFLGSQMGRYIGIIADVLSYPFYTAGSSRISIVTVILAIPIFFAASWLSRISRSFIDAALKKMPINKATGFTIAQLARWGIMTIAILIGLSLIGVDLSSIAVIFGVLGIGIGFGLQNTVANFFAGLIIFFERPIKEGDRIIVDGLEGDIVQIRLRSTIINTLTNETIEDIATADPEDFTLNGVVGSEVKGGDDCLVISFDDDAIAATVAVGLDVEMRLEGRVSGVDYIDVIQDKANGNGRGKSELKSEAAALSQNEESGPRTNNGKGNGKESAPGQNK